MNKKRNLSEEKIEWLKKNYATTSAHNCIKYMHIGYKRLWELAAEYGLQKEKPTDFEKDKKVQIKPKCKTLHEDEGSIRFCIDCTHYQIGAICQRSGQGVGALWKKKCFKGRE